MRAVLDVLVVFFLLSGATFTLLASIGLLRMPDLFNRMQAASKASTLGVACIALASAAHFGTLLIVVEAGLVIIFLFATAPIASHLVGRAAYGVGVELDGRTVRDDLAEAHADSAERRRRLRVPQSDEAAARKSA